MKRINRHFLFYTFGHGSSVDVHMHQGAVVFDCVYEDINGGKTVSILALEDTTRPKVFRRFKCYGYAQDIPEFTNSNTRYWHIGTIQEMPYGSTYPVYHTIWEVA